jgi:hypothetical protein
VQFTAQAFTQRLLAADIQMALCAHFVISMDAGQFARNQEGGNDVV